MNSHKKKKSQEEPNPLGCKTDGQERRSDLFMSDHMLAWLPLSLPSAIPSLPLLYRVLPLMQICQAQPHVGINGHSSAIMSLPLLPKTSPIFSRTPGASHPEYLMSDHMLAWSAICSQFYLSCRFIEVRLGHFSVCHLPTRFAILNILPN